ncbi:Cyclin-domain-containing protein [Coniochaeta hoffmannii]|uniref:Cyclin-domain-containing protein n=1 Tax=Coniochaeta hoffmannii TaxID=91930 RepID=A0AA38SB44_9PEZI|nr:Cyclin-domain-containing protein [Coniochaeta hoffmannii]
MLALQPTAAHMSEPGALTGPPPPPTPSADPELAAILSRNSRPFSSDNAASGPDGSPSDDICEVPAAAVLELLSLNMEALVRVTGDVPPTPPPTIPTVPHMRGMQAEKENIVRSHSEKNLAMLAAQAAAAAAAASSEPKPTTTTTTTTDDGGSKRSIPGPSSRAGPLASMPLVQGAHHEHLDSVDGVRLRSHGGGDIGSPLSSSASPTAAREPYIIHGENAQPLNTQHAAMTRRFYSKRPPPISITAYLARIHRFCPMSTAVYLATSLYIQRLAVKERAIAVTGRNVHRLLLAGLRVAMKALEDTSYSMSKMAKVGGVSEVELARLEINFCFLTGFELVCGPVELQEQWDNLRSGAASWAGLKERGPMELKLDVRPKNTGG